MERKSRNLNKVFNKKPQLRVGIQLFLYMEYYYSYAHEFDL